MYNQEDCYALKLLVSELERIQYSAHILSDVDFAQTPKSQMTEVSKKVNSQFEMILRFANVKYEKKKISFSQGKLVDKRKRGGANPSRPIPKPDKILEVPQAEYCLNCGYIHLKLMKAITSRTIIDLILSSPG